MAPRDGRTGQVRPSPARLLGAQVVYQLRVLLRSPIGSFATLVIPAMVLLAVGLLFDGVRLTSRGDIRFVQFLTPAMVAFSVLTASYMSVVSTTTLAREEGILMRIRSTPLPPWIYMAGRIVAAAVVGVVSSSVVIGLGAGVYGFQMVWSAIPVMAISVLLATVCFCSLGLAVSSMLTQADSALPIAWGSILPLCFISDVFQPIDTAPAWLGAVASCFPLRPFADVLESACNPMTAGPQPDWSHLAVLAAWGAGAAVFALLRFRWEPGAREHRSAGSPTSGTESSPAATASTPRVRDLVSPRRADRGLAPIHHLPRAPHAPPGRR